MLVPDINPLQKPVAVEILIGSGVSGEIVKGKTIPQPSLLQITIKHVLNIFHSHYSPGGLIHFPYQDSFIFSGTLAQ